MLLTEFDPNKKSVINPEDLVEEIENFPKVGVSCFSAALFNRVLEIFKPRKIAATGTACIDIPVYELEYDGLKIALFLSCEGAPACVACFEDIMAMGLQTLILFGTCGVHRTPCGFRRFLSVLSGPFQRRLSAA
jgi:hypothetical protein